MPCAKVSFGELLALAVRLNGSVVTAELFMLLANAQVSHYFDSDKVVELIVEAFELGVGATR